MTIQSETYAPKHMTSDARNFTMWLIMTFAVGITTFAIVASLAPLVWWASGRPFDIATWDQIYHYLAQLGSPGFIAHAHSSLWHHHWMTGFGAFFGSGLIAMFVAAIVYAACPYQNFDKTGGDKRWAVDKDIRRMEARKQIGIIGGTIGVLGKWHDGRMIRLIETISVACSAPPGTGKTAALVIPSIIDSDDVSMIVNDPKPELADATSGYRAEIGYVFILDWSMVDEPEKGIFYPRFNFLSPLLVPAYGTAGRDTYLDAIAKVLIPEGKGGGDKYFVDKGRDALTGFMHALLLIANDAPEPDLLPAMWKGREASFPMMIDWMAEAGYDAEASIAKSPTNKAIEQDSTKAWLTTLCATVKGKAPRGFTSLQPLVNMADKERSGVLGTMDQALLPFKNAAVKERTSSCDFVPSDLRGMRCPITNQWMPVTLYICVNQAEAEAFANITALLYEVMSREFLAYGPNETTKRIGPDGELIVMGDKPIVFMLDEFAKLPPTPSVLKGPDLGRSKKVSYWLIFQARAQIVKAYSKEDGTIIDSTCGVQIVLSQNDPETAKHYQAMVGKTTTRKLSTSRQAGISKQANPFARSESYSTESVEFLRDEDILSMPVGTHLVLAQNFLNRPMRVISPMYFEDPAMLAKVYNPRTKLGPKPALPLPEFIRLRRVAEHLRDRAMFEAAALEAQKRALSDDE